MIVLAYTQILCSSNQISFVLFWSIIFFRLYQSHVHEVWVWIFSITFLFSRFHLAGTYFLFQSFLCANSFPSTTSELYTVIQLNVSSCTLSINKFIIFSSESWLSLAKSHTHNQYGSHFLGSSQLCTTGHGISVGSFFSSALTASISSHLISKVLSLAHSVRYHLPLNLVKCL